MSRSFIVLSLTLPPITPSMYFSRHGLSWLHSDLSTAASSELEPTITDSALQKKKNLTIHFQVISEWCGIEIDTSNLSADIFFSENFGHLLLSQARLCILTLALQKNKKNTSKSIVSCSNFANLTRHPTFRLSFTFIYMFKAGNF